MLRSYLYGRCMVISSVIEEQDQLSLIQTQTLSSRPFFFAIGCLTGIIAIFCKYSFSNSFSASAVLFLIITGDVILILDITAMKKPRSFPPFDVPSILCIAPFIILLKTVSNSIGPIRHSDSDLENERIQTEKCPNRNLHRKSDSDFFLSH